MSGMEAIAIGAAVGGSALNAFSSVQRGQEEARAAQFEQEQFKVREQQTRTAAAQEEAQRRRELTASMETIQSIRAGRGVGQSSPTGLAILEDARVDSERDIGTIRTNAATAADMARRSGEIAGQRARTSLLSGNVSGASSIFSGVTQAANILTHGRTSSGRY